MNPIFDDTSPYLADQLYPELRIRARDTAEADAFLLKPLVLSSEGIRQWILKVIDVYRLKPTSWAKKAGLAPSTLNRFLNPEASNFTLSTSSLNKLSAVLEQELSEIDHKQQLDKSEFTTIRMVMSQAVYIDFIKNESFEKNFGDDWKQFPALVVPSFYPFHMTVLAAFYVALDVLEPHYPSNTTLITVPIYLWQGDIPHGSHVILHDIADNGSMSPSVWEYAKDPNGRKWLLPLSSDRKRKNPGIFLENFDPATSRMRVTFLIVGSHRFDTAIGDRMSA